MLNNLQDQVKKNSKYFFVKSTVCLPIKFQNDKSCGKNNPMQSNLILTPQKHFMNNNQVISEPHQALREICQY